MVQQQSVYVLRHAHRLDFALSRSEWRSLAQRPTDPPLSALGQVQAAQTGEFFARLHDASIQHVLSSPYQRCIQTAHPIATAVGAKIKVEVGLQEIPPSFLHGPVERHLNRVAADVPLEERAHYFPLLDKKYFTTISDDLAHATDARGIQTRHWHCLKNFLQEYCRDGESFVVVTHGWVSGLCGDSLCRCSDMAIPTPCEQPYGTGANAAWHCCCREYRPLQQRCLVCRCRTFPLSFLPRPSASTPRCAV